MGQRPESRPQARNTSIAVLFGSFSCGYIAKKKNGENYLNVQIRELPCIGNSLCCLCEKTVSVLFGKIAAKRTKNGENRFRACGRDEGSALDLRPF